MCLRLVIRLLRLGISLSLYLTFGFATSRGEDVSRPSLEFSNGGRLIYNIQAKPNEVYYELNNQKKLIFRGPLETIQVSDVNGATIPEQIKLELVERRGAGGFFTNESNQSFVTLADGRTLQFDNVQVKKLSILPLKYNEGLFSYQSENGLAATIFYEGASQPPKLINRQFYSGTAKFGMFSGLKWGGQDLLIVQGGKTTKSFNTEVPSLTDLWGCPTLSWLTSPVAAMPLKPHGTAVPEPKQGSAGVQDEVARTLKNQVIEQDTVIDAYLDTWRKISKPHARKKHAVIAVLGPTGAGKTFSAEKFAEVALGDPKRLLEIDASQFTDSHLLDSLFGAANGYISSDKTKGRLIDFLKGPGAGKNVIVFNEIDKACPEFFTRLMEMMDTGKAQGGDGNSYSLGQSLIILTSNKGSAQIYPRGKGKALNLKEIKARRDKFDSNALKELFIQPDPTTGYDQRKRMPPEVANRIQEYVVAMPVSTQGAQTIATNELAKIVDSIYLDDGYKIEFDPAVTNNFVETRYLPENGTRPLVNELDNLVYKITKMVEEIPQAKQEVIKVHLLPETDDEPGSYEIEVAGTRVILAAPKPPNLVDNPLIDPDARYKLLNLEDKIKKTVYGQDDAVNMVARAIRTKSLNTLTGKPAIAVLSGPTGTGKSEIGKAVASEVFGDAKRLLRLDMGDVQTDAQFNNIFGSAKGYLGSDSLSPFEQFLIDFPEGGTIMFDEIGNMGKDRETKTALLKKFYAMLDEGQWRSPQGKVYDLSKYFILFTTNEGDEIYKGLPSDDLRLATWEQTKGKQAVASKLREHGWPAPLVARLQGNTATMKPLTAEEREYVAQKLVTTVFDQLGSQHSLTKYEVEPNFYKKVGVAFFSHEEGARKIRDMAEQSLTDLIGDVLMDNYGSKELRHSTLLLSINDNYQDMHSYKGDRPPLRVVKLIATLHGPSGDKVYEANVTDDAAMKQLHNEVELKQTARHEAGHGLVNDPSKTGEDWDYVTIETDGNYGGYARYRPVAQKKYLTREDVVAKIARLLGGSEAERLSGIPQNSGWAADRDQAHELAVKAVNEYGLSPHPLQLKSDQKTEIEVQELLNEGQTLANKTLREKWPLVLEISDALESRGHLNKAEIDEITREHHSSIDPNSLKIECVHQNLLKDLSH